MVGPVSDGMRLEYVRLSIHFSQTRDKSKMTKLIDIRDDYVRAQFGEIFL